MNIFFCHLNPILAALFIDCQEHINKMGLEAVQCLYATLILMGVSTESAPNGGYKRYSKKNDIYDWMMESEANFLWVIDYARAMFARYRGWTEMRNAEHLALGYPPSRTQEIRDHASLIHLPWIRQNMPKFKKTELTPFPLIINEREREILGVVYFPGTTEPDVCATYRKFVHPDQAYPRFARHAKERLEEELEKALRAKGKVARKAPAVSKARTIKARRSTPVSRPLKIISGI